MATTAEEVWKRLGGVVAAWLDRDLVIRKALSFVPATG